MSKKFLSLLLCAALCLGLGAPALAEGGGLPLEEIVIYVPGDAPAGLDQVEKAIEEACRDELNIDLKIIYAGWDDYGGKLQMALAAGQKYSLVYDASWGSMNTSIAGGYYEALDDLIREHAPNLVATKTEEILNANRAKGPDGEYHLYGIPLGDYYGRAMQFLVRKDIREEMGVPEIKTEQELIDFAYKVKEAHPELTPIITGRAAGNTMAAMLAAFDLYEIPDYMWITDMGWEGVFYFKNNDGKIYNIFDDMPKPLWEDILLSRKLYQDGILHPDVMSLPDWYAKVQEGSCAISCGADIGVAGSLQAALSQADPNGVYEAVTFYDFAQDKKFATDFKAWDFCFIPSTSTAENKARTLQFLNWVAESQENFDLCAYGIQGVTWEPVGDKQFKVDSDLWAAETWTWVRNAAYERYDSNYTEADLAHIDRFHDKDFFTSSVLSGFSFNSEPVSNQVSQYNVALQKYWFAIQNGAVDPEEGMKLFREEAYDAVTAICAEMQRQIDAYLGR